MAHSKGFLGLAAFKKASTWGTAVTCGATDGIEFTSESIGATRALIADQQITGKANTRAGTAGNWSVSGEVATALRYEGLEPLLAQVMGTAGAPSTVDTTGKKHALRIKDDLAGIFGTLALQKSLPVVHEVPSVKVTGFSIKASAGGRAEVSFKFAGDMVNENTSGGSNNNTSFASVTLPSNRLFAQFSQLTVRVNAQSGAALTTADAIYVSEWSLDVDRTYKTDLYSTERGDEISEPVQDGWTVVGGSLTFASHADGTGGNAASLADALAKNEKKMDAKFVSTALAGSSTQYYEVDFFLPCIQFGEGTPSMSGPGVISWSLPFTASRVASAPTGMTGITEPVAIDVYSQRAADALA